MSKTLLLFDSGAAYTVSCTLHPRAGESGPLADAYVVPSGTGDFKVAAENAATAVYDLLMSRGLDIPPFVAALKLLDRTSAKTNIAGESSGLIFAIAIAKALLKSDLPDIAATGIIRPDGVVKPVTGLENKIRTAVLRMDGEGIIFYPKDNPFTIPGDLSERMEAQNIRLIGVSHMNEVFDLLFHFKVLSDQSDTISEPTGRALPSPWLTAALILLILAAAALGVYYLNSGPRTPTPPDPAPIVKPVPKLPGANPGIGTTADPEPETEAPKADPIQTSPGKKRPVIDKGFE